MMNKNTTKLKGSYYPQFPKPKNKLWVYTIVMETIYPKDLEDVLSNEFQKVAGHRNKIILYRADVLKKGQVGYKL